MNTALKTLNREERERKERGKREERERKERGIEKEIESVRN